MFSAIGIVILGKRQGCILESNHETQSIIRANEEFLAALGDSVFALPLYKIFNTSNYLKLKNANDYVNR